MNTLAAEPEDELRNATERGLALYDAQLKETLERDSFGKVVAIHADTGDYFVADDSQSAMREMHSRHPHGFMVITRIGPPTSADFRRLGRWDAGTVQNKW